MAEATFGRKDDWAYAIALVRQVCEIAGQRDLIGNVRTTFRELGLDAAIRNHDTDAIFDWLAEAVSYQGVSDQVATTYLDQHGVILASDIRHGLTLADCDKLSSYWAFENCGYRKTHQSCNRPRQFGKCPLPSHDLRNGQLNQASYSLFLFLRDVAQGDLVNWIDQRFDRVDDRTSSARSQILRDAVVMPLLHVHGVSHKVLHMVLANLLLAGDPRRKRWQMAGAAMVAVDTLVHNWLWRTGIIGRLGRAHPYGPACYRPEGCEDVINQLSGRIDARQFNGEFPMDFPRFVQKAIWSFCASAGLSQCNGMSIDDRHRCRRCDCPLFGSCDRLKLDA